MLMLIGAGIQSCNSSKSDSVGDTTTTKQDEYNNIVRYFLTEHNLKLDEQVRKICVVTENGCPSCNVKFGKQISESLSDPHALVLLAANGSLVDISEYIGKPNVYQDQQIDDLEYPIFVHSKVIYLSGGQIDTIVDIEAKELNKSLEFIKTNK